MSQYVEIDSNNIITNIFVADGDMTPEEGMSHLILIDDGTYGLPPEIGWFYDSEDDMVKPSANHVFVDVIKTWVLNTDYEATDEFTNDWNTLAQRIADGQTEEEGKVGLFPNKP